MFEEQKLTKEQHYQQTLEKMLGRQKENEE